jgi:hypothetical protein
VKPLWKIVQRKKNEINIFDQNLRDESDVNVEVYFVFEVVKYGLFVHIIQKEIS